MLRPTETYLLHCMSAVDAIIEMSHCACCVLPTRREKCTSQCLWWIWIIAGTSENKSGKSLKEWSKWKRTVTGVVHLIVWCQPPVVLLAAPVSDICMDCLIYALVYLCRVIGIKMSPQWKVKKKYKHKVVEWAARVWSWQWIVKRFSYCKRETCTFISFLFSCFHWGCKTWCHRIYCIPAITDSDSRQTKLL